MKRKDMSQEYTKVCYHCGKNLHTKQEYAGGRYNSCQEAYAEEMYAIYGDEWYK